MSWAAFQTRMDSLIRQYRAAILGTLLVHAIFFLLMILFEVAHPRISPNESITIEFAPDPITDIMIPQMNEQNLTGDDDFEDLKNIESNAAEQNKSFDDYYREVKEIVNKTSPNEPFIANDYKDLRDLAKDYTKENGFEVKTETTKDQNNSNSENTNSKNTYAGKTVITYNLGGRKASKLPVPAYQCLGNGEVIIEINVNQKGYVTSVIVISAKTSLNEDCLTEAARIAAQKSRFAIDLKAPASQKGTIHYKFVQQ